MVASALTALSDAELLDLVRRGDEAAFTELYTRHRDVAQRMAAVYARPGEADDLVDVAFEKVLGALRRGHGPSGAFRAYLFVTLRRLAAEQAERPRERSLDDLPEPVAAVATTPGLDASEREMITSAFESLPGRWQAVLWHTAVEGRNPRDLASTLGMSANAVSALAYRAREKLRQAYLQAHLQAAPHPQCEPHRSCLGAYVRDGQSRRERRATSEHLQRCRSCQALVSELNDVNRLLARAVLPLFLVGSTGKIGAIAASGLGVADAGTEVTKRSVIEWARLHHVGSIVSGMAATTALVVGLVELRPHITGDDPVRTDPAGTTLMTNEPNTDELLGGALPGSDAVPCPVAASTPTTPTTPTTSAPDPLLDEVDLSDGVAQVPSGTTTTKAPTPTEGLGGLLAPITGLLLPPTTATAPSPVNLTQVVCTPTQPGHSDLTLMIAGSDEPTAEVDVREGAVDVELGGVSPVQATVTVDLSEGARVALGAGLPAGCEVAEDRHSLTCALDTLLPGAPTEIVGLEVEALQGGDPSATVTLTADGRTVVSQTIDLSAVTGLLDLP